MAYIIQRAESNASRRIVYLWCVGSNGTTPAASEQDGQPTISTGGGPTVSTASTLRAWNAAQGEYYVTLTAAEVANVGQGVLRYNSATALETSTPFQVVNYDSGDSMRLGLFSLPNAAAQAAGGLITVGTGAGQLNVSAGSVGILAATHSGVTIQGVTQIGSSVTLHDALYSTVTVRIDPQTYSGLTVGVNNLAPGTYSGATVEVSNIGRTSMQSQADRMLNRSLGMGGDGGRTVQDALRALRNNVQIAGSVLTVYSEDDQTSAWTASVSTTATVQTITGVDPGGP